MKASYDSALNSYLTFCQIHGRPIDPTADNLSFFVVFMSSHIKPDSVDSYLSGICNHLEMHFLNICAACTSHMVSHTMAGCKKRFECAANRKLPLSQDDLLIPFHHYLHLQCHDDLLFLAQLYTGFAALLHCGELTWPDAHRLQTYRKAQFIAPHTKLDRFGHGSLVLVCPFGNEHNSDNVLDIVKRYIDSRDLHFPHHPELWLRSSGQIPTRSWFVQRLQLFYPKEVAGHSMWSGGATFLASKGTPPHLIQAAAIDHAARLLFQHLSPPQRRP
ncbi:hypothetical protein HYDPIDRAFT_177247 [Hydnomerulius pinastri MD-312]|uniref:Uncharacterized protein n=1 Tax=Hydnomerulius pinastri MD-312 TaxID=994086 RepID=A0A0C9VST4_9AGAM|nr:hypothetical protein HYDPIDRAFT_177247 [Hydnomerulius pinastri MD-312]